MFLDQTGQLRLSHSLLTSLLHSCSSPLCAIDVHYCLSNPPFLKICHQTSSMFIPHSADQVSHLRKTYEVTAMCIIHFTLSDMTQKMKKSPTERQHAIPKFMFLILLWMSYFITVSPRYLQDMRTVWKQVTQASKVDRKSCASTQCNVVTAHPKLYCVCRGAVGLCCLVYLMYAVSHCIPDSFQHSPHVQYVCLSFEGFIRYPYHQNRKH